METDEKKEKEITLENETTTEEKIGKNSKLKEFIRVIKFIGFSINMALNLSTEYLFDRFVVFRGTIDANNVRSHMPYSKNRRNIFRAEYSITWLLISHFPCV